MAKFIRTKKEFHRYIGPQLRNLVQQITRKYRIEIGECKHCGSDKNLEAAHVKGKERIEIINSILNYYHFENEFEVNLIEFEEKFKKGHEKIDEVIMILCKNCHSIYDNKILSVNSKQVKEIQKPKNKNRIYTNTQIQIKLTNKLKQINQFDLEKYCEEEYCNRIFKINSALLLKIPKNTPIERKKEIVRDNSVNRWTWKYEFSKGNFIYAVSTQWYRKNDQYVKDWLEKN